MLFHFAMCMTSSFDSSYLQKKDIRDKTAKDNQMRFSFPILVSEILVSNLQPPQPWNGIDNHFTGTII
jgi:hypothetical protein